MTTPKDITDRYIDAYYALYRQRIVKSRAEFCNLTNLLPQNFSTMEQGKRLATMTQICGLITNLHIRPDWIMTGEGEML